MGFNQLNPSRKEPNMSLQVMFGVLYVAAVQANFADNYENWGSWPRGSHQHFQPTRNFATAYRDVNQGRMSGKEFPREVFHEMEGHARRSGCTRDCLMCLSHIQCTDKMQTFFPGGCPSFEGVSSTVQGSMHNIPGFREMEPMEQFMVQVHQCEDCTNKCLKSLSNTHCSDLLEKWIPQMCSHFGDKNKSQMDSIRSLAGDH